VFNEYLTIQSKAEGKCPPSLRNNSTTAEIRLWLYLKGRQMMGYDFHESCHMENDHQQVMILGAVWCAEVLKDG